MKPGAYSNSVSVVSNGGSKNIDIRMQVGNANLPLLYISTMHLDFNQDQISLPIDIKNNGSETLEWSVVEHLNWINITPYSGTTTNETDNFVITVNRASLQTGTYAQNIIVNSNGGSATVLINMFVGENTITNYAITRHATNVNNTSALLNGTVTPDNQETIVLFEYGTSESYGNQILAKQSTINGNTDTDVNVNLTGLQENTTYHYRVKIQNGIGTYYGVDMIFTTSTPNFLPTVNTTTVSNINQASASSGGNVTTDGNTSVTARGICWSTSQNPTTSNSHTTDGTGTGVFTSSITNLTANTTYYVRAYATNSQGTSYGSQYSFNTSQIITSPTVSTTAISDITQTTASSGGNVTSDGNTSVTARGVCWSTSQNPITSNSHTTDGTGTGVFTSSITNLTANTTYYVRAYATNSQGTSYGSQYSFNTSQIITSPTVSTTAISDITQTTASSGGNVTSDGNTSVTARGVCWSTSQNPITSNSHTTDGTGTGVFTSSITGLAANTTYYVRAYATNSQGTDYGSQYSLITNQTVSTPTVSTTAASNITQFSASIGGKVTSDENASITTRGICWNTSQYPTTSNNKMMAYKSSDF